MTKYDEREDDDCFAQDVSAQLRHINNELENFSQAVGLREDKSVQASFQREEGITR